MGKGIETEEGQEFSVRVMHYLRELLVKFQQETGNVYNLEATPTEGTSYRLAMLDTKRYDSIITAGTQVPYYFNSTQLPVISITPALTAIIVPAPVN